MLAYLAARCVRACDADLRVQDVSCEPAAPTSDGSALLWPLRITGEGDLKLDIKLIFAHAANYPQAPIAARLALIDQLDDGALSPLEAGDLLVSDDWSLYSTSSGMSGLLELCIPGSDERVLVSLEREALRLAASAPPARKGQAAALILARLPLSVSELAQLMDGASLPCPPLTHATLETRGREVARGRLVRFQGQLALEVSVAREQDIDHSTR